MSDKKRIITQESVIEFIMKNAAVFASQNPACYKEFGRGVFIATLQDMIENPDQEKFPTETATLGITYVSYLPLAGAKEVFPDTEHEPGIGIIKAIETYNPPEQAVFACEGTNNDWFVLKFRVYNL